MGLKFETEDLDIDGIITTVIDSAGICPDERTMAAIRLIVKRVTLPYQRDIGTLVNISRHYQEAIRLTDQECQLIAKRLKELIK